MPSQGVPNSDEQNFGAECIGNSDSRDNGSTGSLAAAIAAAQRSNTVIHSVLTRMNPMTASAGMAISGRVIQVGIRFHCIRVRGCGESQQGGRCYERSPPKGGHMYEVSRRQPPGKRSTPISSKKCGCSKRLAIPPAQTDGGQRIEEVFIESKKQKLAGPDSAGYYSLQRKDQPLHRALPQ